MGQIPLEAHGKREIVKSAAVTDLHSTYKEHIKRLNLTRPKNKQIRGMTYFSFCTWFRFARYLGMVEKVGEEPANMPADMSRIVKTPSGRISSRKTSRILYALTNVGIADEKSWLDLTKSWKEGWKVPQKIEYIEVPMPKRIELPSVPDKDALRDVMNYLVELLPHANKIEAQEEIVRIAEVLIAWEKAVNEDYIYAVEEEYPEAKILGIWVEGLHYVNEALRQADIERAIDNIKLLYTKL